MDGPQPARIPPTVEYGTRKCPACGELMGIEADYCNRCGLIRADEEEFSQWPEDRRVPFQASFLGKQIFRDKYLITWELGERGGIQTYSVFVDDPPGGKFPGILRVAPLHTQQTAEQTNRAVGIRAKTDETPSGTTITSIDQLWMLQDTLESEYRILSKCRDAALPQIVDFFEEDGHRFFITRAGLGTPILAAWREQRLSVVERMIWLEKIRSALHMIHNCRGVATMLRPNRILVQKGGVVIFRDSSGLAELPLHKVEASWVGPYCAPEILTAPRLADERMDAYSFGALLCALEKGRELTESDFQFRGMPKPITDLLPNAAPPLTRVLAKTFVTNADSRFPLSVHREKDPTGFLSLGAAIADYARSIQHVSYDIAGWTSTGAVRSGNEDCFSISHLSAGAKDYRRQMAFVCVADGMGGHYGGDVASSLAVTSVAAFLRERGMSSASLEPLGDEHPFYDLQKCGQTLRDAVKSANAKIREVASSDPDRSTMGCTIEAIFLAGRRATICHVGDSRVYHISRHGIQQVTRDHTVVNCLIAMGQISRAEAAVHPRRSELSQAVGVQEEVDPDIYYAELAESDWLIACSDGLNAHVSDQQIRAVLDVCSDAESAARRLVSLAIVQGGSDNITLVVMRAR